MIIQEQIVIGGQNLIRTYSDQNLRIRQETGSIYDEAIDVLNSGHIYTETDEQIDDELNDSEALNTILGRSEHDEQD